jgi:hypothetical protein
MRYCRLIDGAVFEILRNETSPLVLAGVEKLLSIYSEATEYPNLMEDLINGNPELMSETDLHRQGWQAASGELEEIKRRVLKKYHALKGTGLASADLPSILSFAFDGRIDRLVIGNRVHQWGLCDENGRNAQMSDDPDRIAGALDLLDVAACKTLLKGGEVFALEPHRMPEKAPAIATLRF